MWAQVKSTSSLIVAEMWKELFEGEGIPTRIIPASGRQSLDATYHIFVPRGKEHLIEEVLRKV